MRLMPVRSGCHKRKMGERCPLRTSGSTERSGEGCAGGVLCADFATAVGWLRTAPIGRFGRKEAPCAIGRDPKKLTTCSLAMARDTRRTEHVKARESDRASTSEGERRRGGTQGRVTDLYIL